MTRACLLAVALLLGCIEEDVGDDRKPVCDCSANPHSCCCTTPIILDLEGDGIELTSWEEGVSFVLDPRRGETMRAWTARGSDDAWLYLDNTGDGLATDGFEMFGDMSEQAPPPSGESPNGYLALAEHDTNGDGIINARDRVFPALRLWQDANHDGVSTEDEVSDLKSHGIEGLSVVYKEPRRPDPHGNLFRYSAAVLASPGSKVAPTSWDVALTSPTSTERAAAGLPEPVPASNTPPPRVVTARTAAASADPCALLYVYGSPVYSSTPPWGTVVGRAQWIIGSRPASACPLLSKPTAVQLNQYHLGQWRGFTVSTRDAPEQSFTDAFKVCRFPNSSAWRTWAEFSFQAPWAHLYQTDFSGERVHPCSEYRNISELPPCEVMP